MAPQNIAEFSHEGGGASIFYDPKIRGIFYQAVIFIVLIVLVYWIVGNTIANLQRAHITSGFAFLKGRAGFDISQTLIDYSSNSTYKQAFFVGLLNTLYVAVIGIVTASILGFLIGVGRLSKNWLIRKLCTIYVEIFRNIPPLLVIFFWYFGVLSVLPQARDSVPLPLGSYLNNRGIFLPALIWGEKAWLILIAFIISIILSLLIMRWAHKRQMTTGEIFPAVRMSLALLVSLPLFAFIMIGFPVKIDYPQLGVFNLSGGMQLKPEFLSLFLALSFYTAAFIAETVRAGIVGVNKGQTEAAYALGLRSAPTMRLIIIPQALRIIIPPLSSQYLNLTKNSSLAIAIGYPDLVAVGGTILNQTGQSIEVVTIWMIVYLSISLITSGVMNWFNAKMALVER